MKKIVLSIILLLSVNFSLTQTVTLRIVDLVENKAALFTLSGEKISLVDSVNANSEGNFKFGLDSKQSGIYRLTINNNTWLDFIHDNEDIELETASNNIVDSLKVIKSESNKIYYEFIKLNKDYKTKTELLQLILARYPKEDDYYQATKEKLIQVQEDYLYFVNVKALANPNSFIARYVRSAQLPVVETNIPFEEQLTYLKTHSLDNVNFNDDGLIYSDAFTNKTIEYLTYYRNPQLPLDLLEKEFMSAIDTILGKAKVNEIVYTHIVEYLLDGFKKFGFNNVINYIVEDYVIKDDLCLDEKLTTTLDRRIQQARNFKIGTVVPNIILTDSSGLMIELNKINADKTLIIFYASWCPHCQKLLPEIYDLYKNQKEKKFEVIAVSIDTVRTDWLDFVRTNNLNWLNVSDLKGWNGEAVTDYYIYATPTIFLIDRERKLIALPKNIEEIVKGG
jgi:thiol-disulfide isomerase/thioredoxin